MGLIWRKNWWRDRNKRIKPTPDTVSPTAVLSNNRCLNKTYKKTQTFQMNSLHFALGGDWKNETTAVAMSFQMILSGSSPLIFSKCKILLVPIIPSPHPKTERKQINWTRQKHIQRKARENHSSQMSRRSTKEMFEKNTNNVGHSCFHDEKNIFSCVAIIRQRRMQITISSQRCVSEEVATFPSTGSSQTESFNKLQS